MQVVHVLSNLSQTWSDCCCQVQAKENEYWKTDIAVEDEIEQIIIQIGPAQTRKAMLSRIQRRYTLKIRQEEKPLTPPDRRVRP